MLVSGVAGLLAGAFSMAAGEYVSVRSQREMFEHQIGAERDELAKYPARGGGRAVADLSGARASARTTPIACRRASSPTRATRWTRWRARSWGWIRARSDRRSARRCSRSRRSRSARRCRWRRSSSRAGGAALVAAIALTGVGAVRRRLRDQPVLGARRAARRAAVAADRRRGRRRHVRHRAPARRGGVARQRSRVARLQKHGVDAETRAARRRRAAAHRLRPRARVVSVQLLVTGAGARPARAAARAGGAGRAVVRVDATRERERTIRPAVGAAAQSAESPSPPSPPTPVTPPLPPALAPAAPVAPPAALVPPSPAVPLVPPPLWLPAAPPAPASVEDVTEPHDITPATASTANAAQMVNRFATMTGFISSSYANRPPGQRPD